MRHLLSATTILFVILFYLQGCASHSLPKKSEIKGLYHAKYQGNKIWQDEKINITKKMSSSEAEEYCENLTLLDLKGWKLPTKEDVEQIENSINGFAFIRQNAYYHTSDLMCPSISKLRDPILMTLGAIAGSVFSAGAAVTGERCKYYLTSNGSVKYKGNRQNAYVKCVLNPEVYMEKQRINQKKANFFRQEHTYEGYINAFMLTKDIDDLQQAYSLAETDEQKAKIEKLLVKNIPADQLIDVTLKNQEDTKINTGKGDVLIFSYAVSQKDILIDTIVSSKQLEYGSYKVTIEYTLSIPYKTTVTFLVTVATKEVKTMIKEEIYTLNSENGYKDTKTITFSNVIANQKVWIGSVEAQKGTKITAKVLDIEVIE